MTDNRRDQNSETTDTAAEGGTTGQSLGTATGAGDTAAEGGTTGEATGTTQDTASGVGGTTDGNLGRIADGEIGRDREHNNPT